jgi:membrane fusion protein
MEKLFRKEAMDAKRASWLGDVCLAQPLALWMMASFAMLAILAIGLLLFFGSYTRRSQVSGYLVPAKGLTNILAPATGVVTKMYASEGLRVRSSQLLAVISLPLATVREGNTAVAMSQRLARREQGLQDNRRAQTQLLDAKRTGLAEQLTATREELAQLQKQISTAKQQQKIALETLNQFRHLRVTNFVSDLQVHQQESVYLDATGNVQSLQRQASTTRKSLAQLAQERQEIPGQWLSIDASFQRDLATLEQERVETEARGALAVGAPVSGVVATQLVKLGQTVQSGQPLLVLLPGDGSLEAELFVPSRAIGFIAPGDKVLLRYEAYPYQKFGHQVGFVERVSRSALNLIELQTLMGGATQSEPMYRVTVRLTRQTIMAYGKPESLKPGMVLEANVLGENRRLLEWAFEPLYSLRGRVGGD